MYHQLSHTPQNCTMISLSSRLRNLMPQHLSRSDRHMSNRSHCRHRVRGETPHRRQERLHAHSTRNTIVAETISRKSVRDVLATSKLRSKATQANSGGTPPIRRVSPHNNVSVWSWKVKAQRRRQVGIRSWPRCGT